eukprot:9489316-Pyramimonas_sp.AAC.1
MPSLFAMHNGFAASSMPTRQASPSSCCRSSSPPSSPNKPLPMLLNELCQRRGWPSAVYVDMVPEQHLPLLHTLTDEQMTEHPLYKTRRCKVHEENIFGAGCPR